MKRSAESAFSPNKQARATGIPHEDGKKKDFKPFRVSHDERFIKGGRAGVNVSPTRVLIGSRASTSQGGERAKLPDADLTTQKIINDPIHTSVKLDRLCVRVMDTPQYQRLRSLKQLGTCVYVFPSATHSRFEHSLGVAHLSQRVCEALVKHQPELHIIMTMYL